ncbi:MAG: MarR family transcriptional regulator [Actinobacteria bacterium]|nr:MarR family transcriptional regulator [Actinomycetota bacterium]
MKAQTPTAFGPALIGQTEKALDAILVRELDGTGLSPSGWVILKLAAGAGGRLGRQDLIDLGQAQAKFDPEKSTAAIESALSLGLLEADRGELVLTPAARELQDRVVGTTDEIRARLWGDLPEADLAAAGRVLSTALTRANAELGYSI